MKLQGILLVTVLYLMMAESAYCEKVLDLGTIGTESLQRGPELQLIDPNVLSRETARHLVAWELKEIEKKLLEPQKPEANQKEEKKQK